ncbi:putative membrane protein [Dinghuibacter silviterrae]|uniref:Putative membrane protein n=2 Tax=Dinghuibacter silviterrae TaxID=1539049 RepID=A0A4R8DFF7_9BACT|nr:putative membrane protein [Dinghuibacter silviterrae]
MDTIILSYIFTGQITSALKIGAVEVVTKILLYYLHERLWMRVDWLKTRSADGTMVDNHYRSLIKGASYRFFGTLDTIVIALFITGNYTKAFSIGVTEVFTKIGFFYIHERIWQRIPFGIIKEETPAAAPAAEAVRA